MKRGIEPDLQVISRGLTAEQSKALSNTIFGILNHLDRKAGFDFRRLHRIILTDDFAKELAGLSADTPSGNAIEYTDEKYAQAIAKVVPLRHGEDFEFVMVFKLEYVCSLMDEVKDDERLSEGYSFALHCVHHEFCHIHDYNKKLDALPSYILRVSPTGKNRFTDNLAWTCWSEYFATYTSSPTADPYTISCLAQNLTDGLGRTKQEVDKEIIAYRWHNDLDRLVEFFQRHGEFLVVAAAYVLGYTDGLESPLNELSADAANALAGSYFEPTWNAMHKALRDMRKQYPDEWKSPDIIKPLSQVMENYYSDMGLILSDTDDGRCYISIPMKPETNPYLLKLTLPSHLLPREA